MPQDQTLITRADLEIFRIEFLAKFQQLIRAGQESDGIAKMEKRWIKTSELKKILPISNGSLQKLRNNGKLPCSIVDGLAFYDINDVISFMENAKNNHRKNRRA